MRRQSLASTLAVTWALVGCAHVTPAAGAEETAAGGPKTRLTIREGATALLADSKFVFHVEVESPYAQGTVSWRHTLDDRTLSAGEVPIGKDTPAAFELRAPSLKEGVSVLTNLVVSVSMETGGARPSGITISKMLSIVDPNPFTGKKKWLESLELSLYDPLDKTAEALEAIEVRPKRIASVGALERIEQGIVLIGEGIELDRTAGVADAIFQLAQRGVSVVCLAPKSGDLPLPVAKGNDLPGVCFCQGQIVANLDKRLSAEAWFSSEAPAAGEAPIARFAPVAIRGQARLAVSEEAIGWPWVEVDYSEQTSVVLCGFPLVATWQRDATARYLLAAVLQMLKPDKETKAE